MFPSSSFTEKGGDEMDEIVLLEGPVMKIGGELSVLIAVGSESADSFSECLKVVISDRLARLSQIEVGDLICLKSCDGQFSVQPVKAKSTS
jgi:hypothetical protein